jgi:hypothetical protein
MAFPLGACSLFGRASRLHTADAAKTTATMRLLEAMGMRVTHAKNGAIRRAGGQPTANCAGGPVHLPRARQGCALRRFADAKRD